MSKIVISNMAVSDLDSISTTLQTDFDDFWNYNTFKSELLNSDSTYFIAKAENEIVGFGGIWKSVDDAHITNIVVKKSFRNKRIGSQILEKLIDYTKQLNLSSLTLEVNENNTIAQKLYLKYNFKKIGIRKNYYKGFENAIIMTLYFL